MWETSFCDFANGGWFWIFPLIFMTLCLVLMFVGHKKGRMMGCMGVNHSDQSSTRSQSVGSATDIARQRYAAGEIAREKFQQIMSGLDQG